ncbi:MAG: UDP-2,3-diacylglucosamine diphosphatase [Bacteroidia bacterium]|nr:UDP-2,3-diacylglucosamine diphosphatase [Bacteroidia bacterium]
MSKKTYFISDFHLGVPNNKSSLEREKKVITWLEEIEHDAREIYFMGDVFDFWFEYKHVVPKGYVRLLGKIASICDKGIPVHYFTGNHDMWAFDYLPTELGVIMHREPIEVIIDDKKFFLGHGDGLGPGDSGYKFIKKVFSNKVCQWLFARLHPNFGIGLANYWSRKSRAHTAGEEKYMGDDKEFLVQFCKDKLKDDYFDYFVFGHRHLPLDMKVGETSRYVNLGDWISHYTYAVFDGSELKLESFKHPRVTAS